MPSSALFPAYGFQDIVVRTTVVYLFLLVVLRLAGKRELGHLTLFDLVVTLVIANGVQNAMVGPDASLLGGLASASTLIALNTLILWLRRRSRLIEQWLGGVPTPIVQDGCLLHKALAQENLTENEVMMALREHGVDHLEQVDCAYMEPDGAISVVLRTGRHHPTKRAVRFRKSRR